MSIHIALDNPPEYYTNLDHLSGRIIIGLNRPELIGAIIVKLEGESKTALAIPNGPGPGGAWQQYYDDQRRVLQPGQIVHENHKILYKVQQVYPNVGVPAYSTPIMFQPGQHDYPFNFRIPFNNACSDPGAMGKIGGLAGAGGYGQGPGLFSLIGGIRVMDGSRQLLYRHVTKTLPPSFTGFPRQAEIRYYIKVTIQRPGLFKENWRYQLGFKFLPIEPPRSPQRSGPQQESFARRPFTFRPPTPRSQYAAAGSKKSGFFGRTTTTMSVSGGSDASAYGQDSKGGGAGGGSSDVQPPSIEVSANLPHPAILTCNKPVPMRLIARKLVETTGSGECYLTSLQIDLIGSTRVRCQDLSNTETSRWVVVSRHGLSVPLQKSANDPVGSEHVVSDILWNANPLPNTVMPSFVTCNLTRSYSLEIKLGVSWGMPHPERSSGKKGKAQAGPTPQTIFLPLHFDPVEVYSGLAPPEPIVEAMRKQQAQRPNLPARPATTTSTTRPSAGRPSNNPTLQQQQPQPPPEDPLYPPQLRPGQVASQASTSSFSSTTNSNGPSPSAAQPAPPNYDDAPPSYSEAMAETLAEDVGRAGGNGARPAYSGETNENAPESLPGEKS